MGGCRRDTFYVISAMPKLMGSVEVVESFTRWGLPDKLYLLVGLLEVICAVGLLIPRTVIWATGGLILLMLFAAVAHIAHGEWAMLPMTVVLMLLLSLVGYLRCPWFTKREPTIELSREAEAK
jgi:uncharacterized membrane protein YphA (DoxX/SURF4 family)